MKIYFNFSKLFKNQFKNTLNASHRTIGGLQLWDEELTSNVKHEIEKYWSSKLKTESYDPNGSKSDKYYVLSMFPYPSGHLHMGHVRVYTISDVSARFQRMNNKNVIHPIGWDAFGLPAENAAIERKVSPQDWTEQNIVHMKSQLQRLGCSFEWHREFTTCDPKYYRWTQELFLKLYEADLVYQTKATVNWDPVDKTVLADEQVDENGCSWRSGVKVEQKLLKQWFVRTTRFAQELYDGLSNPALRDWRDVIKIQKHWIGECDGVAFDFPLIDCNDQIEFVTLWTRYPEYIDKAKFIAVSDKSILAGRVSGTELLNVKAKNPITGELVPIYVTDRIEFLDNCSSHVGVPVVNEQDRKFCDNFGIPYDLELLEANEVKQKQLEVCGLARKMRAGGYWTSAKLRDWLISRQRYWGTPIPIIHCQNCGVVPVPRINLPVKLSNPNVTDVPCPKCQASATREMDTMDTFVDSSWYYLRYLDPNNQVAMFDVKQAKEMMPVDLYIGGKEHAVLHLYYARFISYFLHSLGLLPEKEPFKRLLVQGMVMGRSYRIKGSGQYVPHDQVTIIDMKRNKATHVETGQPVVVAWEKMSKSKHNGVDPNDMFNEHGIDTTRLLILGNVAPTSHRNWNDDIFPGILNWQKRLWLTIREFLGHRKSPPEFLSPDEFRKHDDYMFDSRNFYVKGVTFNYCLAQQFSVAISKMQGLTNSLRKVPPAVMAHSPQYERALACQLIVLAPMAPHFASELWSGFVSAPHRLNDYDEIEWDKPVFEQKWPHVDYNYKLDLVCQVNGVDGVIVKIPRCELEKMNQNQALEVALKQKQVQDMLAEKFVVKSTFKVVEEYESVVNVVATKAICKESVKN